MIFNMILLMQRNTLLTKVLPYKIVLRFVGKTPKESSYVINNIIKQNPPVSVKPLTTYPKSMQQGEEKQIDTSNQYGSTQKASIQPTPLKFAEPTKPIIDSAKNLHPVKGVQKPWDSFDTLRKSQARTDNENEQHFINAGILTYSKAGQYGVNGHRALTPEARQGYTQISKKPQLKEHLGETKELHDYTIIGGSLTVDPETKVLTPQQQHPTFAKRDYDTGDVTVFAMGTSDKGKSLGFAGMSSSKQLSTKEEKNILGLPKGQYAIAIIPSYTTTPEQFTENPLITAFAQKEKASVGLNELLEITERYESVPYKELGHTWDDLALIEDAITHMRYHQAKAKENTDDDDQK